MMIFNLRPGQLRRLLYSIKNVHVGEMNRAREVECMRANAERMKKCAQIVAIIKVHIIMIFPHFGSIHQSSSSLLLTELAVQCLTGVHSY